MTTVLPQPHEAQQLCRLRALMARHVEIEFLLRVGEYQPGNDPLADQAIERMPAIRELLQQRSDEPADFEATLAALAQVAGS